jgi:glycosyltransferase involved in cell wall biosynthesis
MKIVQIAPYYPPYPGGQERFLGNLSQSLVAMGHHVTVLTSRYPRELPFEAVENGVRIYRFRFIGRPFRNPITPGMFLQNDAIRQADVIHTHNEHSFAANAAICLKGRYRKPLVLTVHGHLILDSAFSNLILKAYEKTISPCIFGQSDRITSAWAGERDRLQMVYRIPKQKLMIIQNAVDIKYWRSLRPHPVGDYAWGPDIRNRKVILVATQLIKRKGIVYLIRAMPRILQAENDAILLIAGSGDHEAALRTEARVQRMTDRIKFLGRLQDDELSAVFRAAHVFVLPSLSEGLPICIMEAWAHEKPVVATDIDGTHDAFSKIAELVKPADPVGLAEAILRLLQNPYYAAQRAKAGLTTIRQKYSWSVVAEKFAQVYEEII